jgi:hypothetical protein
MPFSCALSFDITDTYSHVLQVQNIPSFESYCSALYVTTFGPLKMENRKEQKSPKSA